MNPRFEKLFRALKFNTQGDIFSLMEKNFGRVYLYGTCITDLYFGIKPNDFDCVINIKNSDDIVKFLEYIKIPYKRTSFGGYRFEYEGVKIDLWNLKDSYGISPVDYKIDDLLSNCSLNVQSVLYDITNKNILADNRWLFALERRLLDYVSLKTLYPEKLEKQAVKFKNRYGFSISFNLKKAIDKIKRATKGLK